METQRQSGPSEWVKWVAGLALGLNGVVFGYAISIEHRQTKTEENLITHVAEAKDTKSDVYRRLDRQDENITKVLTGINSVQVDVATIKGYMERTKAKD